MLEKAARLIVNNLAVFRKNELLGKNSAGDKSAINLQTFRFFAALIEDWALFLALEIKHCGIWPGKARMPYRRGILLRLLSPFRALSGCRKPISASAVFNWERRFSCNSGQSIHPLMRACRANQCDVSHQSGNYAPLGRNLDEPLLHDASSAGNECSAQIAQAPAATHLHNKATSIW